MGILSDVDTWDSETYGNNIKTLRVLIECEKGSCHKYEYDDAIGAMVIVRDLVPKYKYIYNYGCIPRTLAQDGDNLDAIVISDEPIRTGTIVNVIPRLVIEMIDNGGRDDKIICTPYYLQHGEVDVKKIVKYLRHYKYPNQSGTEIVNIESDIEVITAKIREAQDAYSIDSVLGGNR